MLRGKFVNVIGKPHNLFRETLVNVIGKQCRWGNTITFIGKGLQELLKFPTTVFPYNVYKFSLKRLWGSPITFTILPITIKDFPCNFIVVSLCIVFPYHFYKYEMYFPHKSLQTFTVQTGNCYSQWNQSKIISYATEKVCCHMDMCTKLCTTVPLHYHWAAQPSKG